METKHSDRRPLRLGVFFLALVIFLSGGVLGIVAGQRNIAVPGFLRHAQTTVPSFGMLQEVWDVLQKEYYSTPIDQSTAVYGAIRGMVDSLKDPYTTFFDPKESQTFQNEIDGQLEGIGTEIGIKNSALVVIAPLPDSPAEKVGLVAGDRIQKIDGKTTEGMALDSAVAAIRGKKGTSVTLEVVKAGSGEKKDITIVRDTITIKSATLSMGKDGIGTIKLMSFGPQTKNEFTAAANAFLTQNGKGLILDMRNNPGGYLTGAVDITSFFVDPKTLVVTEKYADGKKTEHRTASGGLLKNVPLVLLVNQGTASAAEIVAGALQDYKRATIVGVKTFGKGSVQQLQDFSDGSSVKVTIAHWYTPSDRSIQDAGITPTGDVPLTDDDYNHDRDPQMEKALELIRAKL